MEAFFAGLAKGCRLTADYTKSDQERLNVPSASAGPPLTTSLQRSNKPSHQVRAVTSRAPTTPPKEIQHWKHRL